MATAEMLMDGVGNVAANGTNKATSFLFFLVEDVKKSPALYVAVTVVLALGILLNRYSNPELDAREPPPMKSKIPIVGHLLGMIKHQSHYFKVLAHRNMGIATLPILNGKLYGIWDPQLVQAAHRNKNLSFEPFAVEFAQRMIGFDNETLRVIKESTLLPEFFDGIHVSMNAANLHRMNANALKYVSKALAQIGSNEVFEHANLFLWVRDLMTLATAEALFGPENPVKKDPTLLEDVWTYEAGLALVMLDIFPSITARKSYQARGRIQAALSKYYGAKLDYHEDAAQIVKNRAAVLRNHGIPSEVVGQFEVALLHVATSNTIPTLFWFMAHVFTRPSLVARMREEVSSVAQQGPHGDVTINIGVLDERCPLLVSCYREAIRLSSKGMGNRRVMEDTTISDGKGRTYLLKKGCNVQMSMEVSHSTEQVWGPDMATFVPERFLETKARKTNPEAEKLKKAAFVPFGGGKHLCPGRNFAFAENLGFVASLLVGFDVMTLNENMMPTSEVPNMDSCSITAAATKPVNRGEGFGVRVRKRAGWENVNWKYTT